jgi:hypothetical protein
MINEIRGIVPFHLENASEKAGKVDPEENAQIVFF